MNECSITIYPVGNGDTSLITLSDGVNILIDYHLVGEKDRVYDMDVDLLGRINKKDSTPHLEVFILSHPHDDHILGFNERFYTGDPKDYSDEDRRNGLILIDEIWFAPRIFLDDDENIKDDAKVFKKEAERRVDLFRNGKSEKTDPGNRVRMIGTSSEGECEDLEDITSFPGDTLNFINGKAYDDFRFFIFAPVKKDTEDDSIGLNNTSIVVQARFDIDGEKEAVRAFFGGDAEFPVWERIVDRNESDNLNWDFFLAPHHCSWSFFSNSGKKPEEDEPNENMLELLENNRDGAYIISSSKPIKDDNDNPPSFKAKGIYIDHVGESNFLCTGEYPSVDEPKPIFFNMSKNGLTKSEVMPEKNKTVRSVFNDVVSTPNIYG